MGGATVYPNPPLSPPDAVQAPMQPPPVAPPASLRPAGLVGLFAAGLAALVAWPLPFHPAGVAIGGGDGDFNGIAWGLWRIARALPHLPDAHVADIVWPTGATLLIADLPEGLLAAPFTLLFGPTFAFNLLQLAHVGLAAAFTAALVRRDGGPPAGAAAAGLAFGFCTVLTTGIHNGNADVTPLYLLPLVALLARDPWRGVGPALALGVAVGIGPWLNPYVGLMGGLTALCLSPWPRRPSLGRASLAVGTALAMGGNFVLLARETLDAPDAMVFKAAGRPLEAGVAWVSGYLIPSLTHEPDPWTRHGWYLGLVPLLLGLLGLLQTRAKAWRWLLLAGIGFVLAMGRAVHLTESTLMVGGSPVWLPAASWSDLPGLGELQITYRYSAMVALALAWLVGQGARRIPARGAWLLAALVPLDLLLLGQGRMLLHAGAPQGDEACGLLAGLEPGPVLDLPGGQNERALFAQTVHGRPVAEGINKPFPREVRAAIDERPHQALGTLAGLGYRYLVIHDGLDSTPDQLRALERIAEHAEEDHLIVARGEGIRVADLAAHR